MSIGWQQWRMVAAFELLALWAGSALAAEVPTPEPPSSTGDRVMTAPTTRGLNAMPLIEAMAKGGGKCGSARTIVEWYVLADGTIADMRVKIPSGNKCHDRRVMKNAKAVVNQKLKMRPGTIDGVSQPMWVQFAYSEARL